MIHTTAEKFLTRDSIFKGGPLTESEEKIYLADIISHRDYLNSMIAFAELHVTNALRAVSENLCIVEHVHRDRVLTAYSLGNNGIILRAAEEFLVRDSIFKSPLTESEKKFYLTDIISHRDYLHSMIDFAKLHVTEALKTVNRNAYCYSTVNIGLIFNSYNLENVI